ncbi:MAG TPA: universal stress protein [Methanospirillum sp.]|uniref:universal stress protein n=1 Tax=Methanospirillum sp. TaxID=45200 RepID=UPI002D182C0E|nr:universal stress protein [Methanospirillum sp.]HWQ65030.1 universal stress protein [Methanospirillum sp.]
MISYKKILIPTDGTSDAQGAITFALTMGKITGAEVTAICVNDVSNYAIPWNASSPDIDNPHYQSCEKAVKKVADRGELMGIDVRTEVVTGIPLQEIIKASKKYDLMVMGTTGRAGVSLMLLGSVAQKVIRFASCPVLVIRGDQQGDLACHRILIPTDGTAITRPAIMHGLEMARTFNAEVTALSVSRGRSIPIPLHRNVELFTPDAAQDAVDSVADMGLELGITVKTTVAMGSVANEIIQASTGHDLLVMGTSGRTGYEYLRLGSVAEKTVRHARCPVLVVRAPETIPLEI